MSKQYNYHSYKPSAMKIVERWNAIEELEPDISTESLFARVCDFFNNRIDHGDVAHALAESGEWKAVTPHQPTTGSNSEAGVRSTGKVRPSAHRNGRREKRRQKFRKGFVPPNPGD